jgi:hypothetical protein
MVGGRWSKFTVVAAIVVAISACFAPVASAEGEEETGASGTFRLRGTHGFTLLVVAFSRPHFKHGEVVVFAYKRRDLVTYLAPAKVTPTTIDADFGRVGKLDVEFQSSGPPERVHARCKRVPSVTFEPGAWVGAIEIDGEEGFTEVHRDRVKAIANPFLEAGCGGKAIGEAVGSDVPGGRLVARSASKWSGIFLEANKNHESARVHLEASIEERRAGLIVSREVGGYFAPGAFEFAPSLQSALLDPPAPFAGHATFRRNAKPSNQLTGNLTVDFPGRADVPLTGGRFKAALVHAMRTERSTR